MKQLILAGDTYQYKLYIVYNKLKEENCVCVYALPDLLGRPKEELENMVLVGTWYKRPYSIIYHIQNFLENQGISFETLEQKIISK